MYNIFFFNFPIIVILLAFMSTFVFSSHFR